jgi:uncharacterized protein
MINIRKMGERKLPGLEYTGTAVRRMNTHTVIIKVTNDCNMDCHYCFVDKSAPRRVIISLDTIQRLLEELEEHSSQPVIHLTWHGGEPMLPGIRFYRKVVELQKRFNKKRFVNAIQTNGTLINDEFAEFFKEHAFLVGVSLDGPQAIHDYVRMDKAGNGTFQRIVENLSLLKRHNVKFGIVATIARHNVGHAEELYGFLKNNSLSTTFSVLFPSGQARDNIDHLFISPSEYSDFLVKIMDLWMRDTEPTEMRSIELILENLLASGQRGKTCIFSNKCHESFLAVGPTGDLYPCCLFQGYENFMYGNIHKTSLSQIAETPVWRAMEERVEYIDHTCGQCDIEEYCHGGCPFNALATHGTILKKDSYCTAYMKAIPSMVNMLGNLVGEISQ